MPVPGQFDEQMDGGFDDQYNPLPEDKTGQQGPPHGAGAFGLGGSHGQPQEGQDPNGSFGGMDIQALLQQLLGGQGGQ